MEPRVFRPGETDMEQDRRSFLKGAGQFIMLTGAASLAWDAVLRSFGA